MKNYIVNNFKAINYQFTVGQLSTYIDLEGCSLKTMMFEKYPSISPYTYCANNPMNKIDPTGMSDEPVYDTEGNHIGNTKEGFTGNVLIYSGSEKIDFSTMTAEEAQQQEGVDTYDNQRANISNVAKSKIWTHIASKLDGENISDETFTMDDIRYGKISCDPMKDKNASWVTSIYGEVIGTDRYYDEYETTVENIQSSVVIHEIIGHIKKGYSDESKTHRLAYKLVNDSHIFQKTTEKYQKFVRRQYWNYYEKEVNKVK